MEISRLCELYKKMKTHNMQHQKFEVKTGAVTFECLFSAPPFELSLTTKGIKKPEFFLFKVEQDFCIKTFLKVEDYRRLSNLLKTHGNSNNKLMTNEWFENIASQIPVEVSPEPKQAEIYSLRRDLEEREKPYFVGWIIWKNKQKPSEENLLKTLMIIGEEAYEYSKKKEVSSRWSADASRQKEPKFDDFL